MPNLNKPVIAAVNGICCGGGLELALSADLILCSDNATFALPEIRSGTVADAASIKLPKRIPYHVAMDLLLTGRWFDAEEAHRWGIVKEITTPETLLAKAWDLARLLESGPPLVYAAIKEVVREAEALRFQDALNRVTKRQTGNGGSALFQRGSAGRRPRLCRESAIRSGRASKPRATQPCPIALAFRGLRLHLPRQRGRRGLDAPDGRRPSMSQPCPLASRPPLP